MTEFTGLFSVILIVTDENCGRITATIERFNDQAWAHRELILVNGSKFTYGTYGFKEVRVSAETAEADAIQQGVGAASGEYCVVWKVDFAYTSDCLHRLARRVQSRLLVDLVYKNDEDEVTVGYAFFRRCAHLVGTPNLTRVTVPSGRIYPEPKKPEPKAPDYEAQGSPHDLNLMCPAGIGDVLWILSKLAVVAKAKDNMVFWLPSGEQHRAGALCRQAGVRYSYLSGLSTTWVWEQPGSPELPESGWIPIQANRHLENGQHLKDWYPQYPICYPKLASCYEHPMRFTDYVIGFMCVATYMGGQLLPSVWADIFHYIEANVAPVLIVGAHADVAFAKEVERFYTPKIEPMYDRPLEEVLAAVRGARGTVGVASGLLISSIAYKTPSIISYPRHLNKMPGTWEPAGSKWDWCFHDRFHEFIRGGSLQRILK